MTATLPHKRLWESLLLKHKRASAPCRKLRSLNANKMTAGIGRHLKSLRLPSDSVPYAKNVSINKCLYELSTESNYCYKCLLCTDCTCFCLNTRNVTLHLCPSFPNHFLIFNCNCNFRSKLRWPVGSVCRALGNFQFTGWGSMEQDSTKNCLIFNKN